MGQQKRAKRQNQLCCTLRTNKHLHLNIRISECILTFDHNFKVLFVKNRTWQNTKNTMAENKALLSTPKKPKTVLPGSGEDIPLGLRPESNPTVVHERFGRECATDSWRVRGSKKPSWDQSLKTEFIPEFDEITFCHNDCVTDREALR